MSEHTVKHTADTAAPPAAAAAGGVKAVMMEWTYRAKSDVRSTDDTIPTHHHEEE